MATTAPVNRPQHVIQTQTCNNGCPGSQICDGAPASCRETPTYHVRMLMTAQVRGSATVENVKSLVRSSLVIWSYLRRRRIC